MVHGCAYFVRRISVLENASLLFWFSFLVHGCAFLLPTTIYLRVGMVFHRFADEQ